MAIFIISYSKMAAVRYNGKNHYFPITAAVRQFAEDAIAVEYCGHGHVARDVLKRRSQGECHLSATELELIAKAK
jgi:hypothetical protein